MFHKFEFDRFTNLNQIWWSQMCGPGGKLYFVFTEIRGPQFLCIILLQFIGHIGHNLSDQTIFKSVRVVSQQFVSYTILFIVCRIFIL